MADPQVIDIGELKTEETITLNTDSVSTNNDAPIRSANFGPGAELLMNDKKKDGGNTPTSDINLADLNNLENELNDLADETGNTSIKEARSVMFENVPSSSDGLKSLSDDPL